MRNKEMYQKLAHLAVCRGVNVQKGQPMLIRANVRDMEFVEMCVKEAYEAGAKYVDIDWHDEAVERMHYFYQDEETLSVIPQSRYDHQAEMQKDGYCMLAVASDEPDGLKGIDQKKISAHRKAYAMKMKDLQKYSMNNEGQWSIVGLPSMGWAKKVFPLDTPEEAYQKLEDAIFMTSRVTADTDPVENWKAHDAELIGHAKRMNEKNFKELHFTSELGTDLHVGLVKDHIWVGGGDTTPRGAYFDPNIPTEEVFCMPERDNVHGVVYASKPLSYGGTLIEGFWFRFENGRVVEYGAKEGQEALAKMLDYDEGSRHLGEVALVPYDSPISQSGILFYNTLYDENAACHLAFGRPYPENLKGGSTMSEEELQAHGANDSMQHVDFMFGTKEMNVDGVTYDEKNIPVFRHGNFVK